MRKSYKVKYGSQSRGKEAVTIEQLLGTKAADYDIDFKSLMNNPENNQKIIILGSEKSK